MSQHGESFRAERTELETVLHSGIFDRSPNLHRFLAFVCEKYFQGHADEIKEYLVAVEALGRSTEFDPKRDSIVRVEAHRLRKRLEKYYQSEGASHSIHITLPPGSYIPEFVFQSNGVVVAEAELPENLNDPRLGPDLDTDSPPGSSTPGAPHSRTDAPVPAPEATVKRESADTKRTENWQRYLLPSLGLMAIAIVFASWIGTRSAQEAPTQPTSGNTVAAALPDAPATLPLSPTSPDVIAEQADGIRILAGSPISSYIDRFGRIWTGDAFYQGGMAVETKLRVLHFTQVPEIYHYRREGEFSYEIPAASGHYELRLHFAEPIFGEDKLAGGGEASRLFGIELNGKSLIPEFDVIADGFGEDNANVKVFRDVQPAADGKVHIRFLPGMHESPIVSAIELLPCPQGKVRPIRIVANDRGFRDQSGESWAPDNHFSGGRTARREPLADPAFHPSLFTGERYGNFTYMIPVPDNGSYRLRLYFCERWFGPETHAGGGAGSRVFDVFCNGKALLVRFDLFREAGGTDKPIVREFPGLRPNAQGKLVLQFVPHENYAMINAIEVIDEGL